MHGLKLILKIEKYLIKAEFVNKRKCNYEKINVLDNPSRNYTTLLMAMSLTTRQS